MTMYLGEAIHRRCPFCQVHFAAAGWRPLLGEHIHQLHPQHLRGAVRDFVEDALEHLELRSVQRSLLLYALEQGRFTVEWGGDSTSLWSMHRRGWFAPSADEGMRERVWCLTDLGLAVARAALARARRLGERVRHPVGIKPLSPMYGTIGGGRSVRVAKQLQS